MRFNIFLLSLLVGTFYCGTLNSQIPEGEIVITASSTLPASRTANFSPDNLMDGTNSSWSEGDPGSGVGESFVFDFRYSDEMKYVVIKNGYGVEKYWRANARIKMLEVTDQNGLSRVLHLEDTPQLRAYGLMELEEDEHGMLFPGEPLSGSYYTFEILEVYEGEKWQDACITEIMVNEWYSENFRMDREFMYQQIFMEYLDGTPDGKGTLYVELEWDGYAPVDVNDGYYKEEIVSGDGTSGFREYRLFINEAAKDYYLFRFEFMRQPDQATMEGRHGDSGPTFVYSFSHEFMKYDTVVGEFFILTHDRMNELFDEDPVAVLSEIAGKDLLLHEIGMRYDKPESARFIYPATGETEFEVHFVWDGANFRLE
ncbi:MAG: hypothetical protein WD577_00545 [Bacteroidales bacterium]